MTKRKGDMKLTYFGHSAFQIETNGTMLLFDPLISGSPHTEGVVSADELNPDVILLTHAHGDHFGDTIDIARRTNAQIISNFDIVTHIAKKYKHENGFGMNTGGWYSFDWGRIQQTYARHSSSFPDGTYGGNPNGFILEIEGKTIYNTGDTDVFAEMEWIGEEHKLDLVLMPVGDCFTMGPARSLRAARMLNPGIILPLHYNTFPVIEIDIDAWKRDLNAAGFDARVPGPGGTLEL